MGLQELGSNVGSALVMGLWASRGMGVTWQIALWLEYAGEEGIVARQEAREQGETCPAILRQLVLAGTDQRRSKDSVLSPEGSSIP